MDWVYRRAARQHPAAVEHIQGSPAAALILDLLHQFGAGVLTFWGAGVSWHFQVLLACDCSPEGHSTVYVRSLTAEGASHLAQEVQDIPVLQATTQRGWAMPELADVRTKSQALERSGFTMAQSPKLRQSSRSALAQVPMHPPPADLYLVSQ